jgi:hypothetical protein
MSWRFRHAKSGATCCNFVKPGPTKSACVASARVSILGNPRTRANTSVMSLSDELNFRLLVPRKPGREGGLLSPATWNRVNSASSLEHRDDPRPSVGTELVAARGDSRICRGTPASKSISKLLIHMEGMPGFDPAIRRFESCHPSQLAIAPVDSEP